MFKITDKVAVVFWIIIMFRVDNLWNPSVHPFILKSGKETMQYIHVDKNRRKRKRKTNKQYKNMHTRYEPNQML